MRFLGWKGGGFEGDLQRLEVDLSRANGTPHPQHLPWNPFRSLPGGRPGAEQKVDPPPAGGPANPAPAQPAPKRQGWNPWMRLQRGDTPNADDLPRR
jgi:hypothetical protein